MNKIQQYIENLIAEQECQNPYLTKRGQSECFQNGSYAEYCSRVNKLFH